MVMNKNDGLAQSFEENSIYGKLSALTLKLEANNRHETVRTPVSLRPCNQNDIDNMLFDPVLEDYTDGKLDQLVDKMMCLDDPNQIRLEGQYKHDDGSFLRITMEKCN